MGISEIAAHSLCPSLGIANLASGPGFGNGCRCVAGLKRLSGGRIRSIRARIRYMTVLSLADARASLSKHIESAATTHERFEITRNGARVAVLLSAEDYDALVETVDILSSPDEVAALRQAIAELESGDVSSADEVRAAMVARGRLAE